MGADKGAGAGGVVVLPDVDEEFAGVEDLAFVLHEVGEKACLDVGEVRLAEVAAKGVGLEVEVNAGSAAVAAGVTQALAECFAEGLKSEGFLDDGAFDAEVRAAGALVQEVDDGGGRSMGVDAGHPQVEGCEGGAGFAAGDALDINDE